MPITYFHPMKTLNEYVVDKKLGSGRYAVVWKAQLGESQYAIKVYKTKYSGECQHEINIFSRLTHSNIVKYHSSFEWVNAAKTYKCIVMELASETLSQYIKRSRGGADAVGIPLDSVKKFMTDALLGLEYLHGIGIIHTDIKPANLLIKRSTTDGDAASRHILIIADLGSATPKDRLRTKSVGTDCYAAPETLFRGKFDESIDIWSLFTTCYTMITGRKLFDIYMSGDASYGSDLFGDFLEDESLNDEDVAVSTLVFMEKVLGPAPPEFIRATKNIYDSTGKIKHNSEISPTSIEQMLMKYPSIENPAAIADFLRCGIAYLPRHRCSASAALAKGWLAI